MDIPDLGSFEYTFTNRELEDVLGFIERRQSGIPGAGEDDTAAEPHHLPQLLLGPSGEPLALQFQPHKSPTHAASAAGEAPPMAGTRHDPLQPFLPPEYGASRPLTLSGGGGGGAAAAEHHGAAVFVPAPEPPAPDDMLPPHPSHQHPPHHHHHHQQQQQQQQQSSKSRGGEGKATISHSTVEKQRRDRINALIDELRDLVPPHPSGGASAAAGGGPIDHAHQAAESSRRPKHAVLSDTIALVRDLRSQLAAAQLHDGARRHMAMQSGGSGEAAALNRQPGAAAHECRPIAQPNGEAEAAAAAAAAAVAAAAAASPPVGIAPTEDGVEVSQGPGCLYVKVHCRDRHGLLADIVRTLKAIPVEITTAAITTTEAGKVYDVFQVVPAPGTPDSMESIKASVASAMTVGPPPAGEKKRRAR